MHEALWIGRRALVAASGVMLLVVAVGCAANAVQTSGPQPTPGAPAAQPVAEGDRAADADPLFALVGAEDPNQPAVEPPAQAEERDVAEPSPSEGVAESPLDDLAEVEPPPGMPEEITPAPPAATYSELPIELNDRVEFWIDFYTTRYRDRFRAGLARSGRYLPMFQRIFAEEGLPLDLVYMAHVESGFKDNAYSRAKAMGIWQFIASTGRHYGLRIDGLVDERRDPEKSARAAAAYLKKLHDDFEDWYLALAAYNAGEGRISRGLAATGGSDFWELARTRHIRTETKNYVPAILAAILIAKDPARYGMEYEPEPELVYDTIPVHGAADFRVLAECARTDTATLARLNPALRRQQTPHHTTTEVRVPAGTGGAALVALAAIPENERVLFVQHRVRRGDTLSSIARTYGVGVSELQAANRMGRKTVIHIGQELTVPSGSGVRAPTPVESASRVAAPSREGKPLGHTVRRGETLSKIARRYATSPEAIAAASGIRVHSTLRVGQRLRVVPGVTSARAAQDAVAAKPASKATQVAQAGARQHTVRRGDTLWRIASLYRTSIEQLCSLNGISAEDKLLPGTRLTVVP